MLFSQIFINQLLKLYGENNEEEVGIKQSSTSNANQKDDESTNLINLNNDELNKSSGSSSSSSFINNEIINNFNFEEGVSRCNNSDNNF